MSIRKNLLTKPIDAVSTAKTTASEIPDDPRCFRRKAWTCKLYLITKAPYNPYLIASRIALAKGIDEKWDDELTYPKYTNQNEESDFEKMPIPIKMNLKQD